LLHCIGKVARLGLPSPGQFGYVVTTSLHVFSDGKWSAVESYVLRVVWWSILSKLESVCQVI
jgi:hypothetical protein